MEQDVFEQLLKYIYTGTAPIDELKFGLINAAKRYDISDLKQECTEVIANNITTDNCIKILVLADEMRITLMETKAIEFINRNKVDVDQLFKDHPHLVLKLFKKF